ncbi:helix-turn-helix domain-containing protein [Modestobacter roseus]|uniref:Helix-turn-helix protein n=1 Tax=Modestobacter roseus TaxID=1181884 RepID=A0A562IW78_9ACTN|nr:helix-turn-helix domain-containing protein [Modestobacter roseus]MQA34899.1 helix-turn-helix domain-containing protein [Modestobacter roseus]TWH75217.1 helix-turn-helix protein [Modestobacter roseus]
MERSVADAAAALGVAESRVRQLLQSGRLRGRKLGSIWLIDSGEIERAKRENGVPGRPLAPRIAAGVLDLLDGGAAPWLNRADRSRARVHARQLAGADARRWRAALRKRHERILCLAHPAALPRLAAAAQVVRAGPVAAAAAGADVVAVGAALEVYVPEAIWSDLARRLAIRQDVGFQAANLVVRVPVDVWPFADEAEARPGLAMLAADLLDSGEPRALSAGAQALNGLAGRLPASRRVRA